jgi:hypothetical protein
VPCGRLGTGGNGRRPEWEAARCSASSAAGAGVPTGRDEKRRCALRAARQGRGRASWGGKRRGCPAGGTRRVGVGSAPPGWVVVGARRCGGNLCGSDRRARRCPTLRTRPPVDPQHHSKGHDQSGGGGALPAGQCGYRLLRRSGCSRRRAAGFRAGPVSEPGKAGRCRRVFAASRRSFRTGQINESERAGRAGVRGVAAGSSYRPGQRTGEGEAAPAGVHGIAAEFSYRPGQRTREGWTVPTGVRGVATEFPCRSGQRTSCEATSAGTS